MLDFLYLFLAFLVGGLVSGAFGLSGDHVVIPMLLLMGLVLLTLGQMKYRFFQGR